MFCDVLQNCVANSITTFTNNSLLLVVFWQMLCWSVADGMMTVAVVVATCYWFMFGRCYEKGWQMEWSLFYRVVYFNLSFGLLKRTSSQMCFCTWYSTVVVQRALGNKNTHNNSHGMKNLSSIPPTEAQEHLLAWTQLYHSTTIPSQWSIYCCSGAGMAEAQPQWSRSVKELKLEGSRDVPTSKPYITGEERRALKKLREDRSSIILTKDKWVTIVVMDKMQYIQKGEDLLNNSRPKRPS